MFVWVHDRDGFGHGHGLDDGMAPLKNGPKIICY